MTAGTACNALRQGPEPRFSILTPVFDPPPGALDSMLASVRGQRFRDWELCLVDDGSSEPHVRQILEAARAEDSRIRVHHRESNAGIATASNRALAIAHGEFVALLDHDDELHPDALALVHEAIGATSEADYIYTDEDKIDAAGNHSKPFIKPDWSPERLRTQMYTCHLSVLRRSLVEEVGGFDPEFEGSQDWDLVLRVAERARAVLHVPRVLYHWRMLEGSAASAATAKPWAFEAGPRAVQAHCDRTGLPAQVEQDARNPGILHIRPRLERQPPVCIVIPTAGRPRKAGSAPLVDCVRSIAERSTYENYEVVCVVDGQFEPAIIAELRAIGGDRLSMVRSEDRPDFSSKVNRGANHSESEHLLLLADDIEVLTPDWLQRLVMYSGHEGIGAVGARLLGGDGRLLHAGVSFQSGPPESPYRGFPADFRGYMNAVLIARDCLAVCGECLMTPRAAFDELGGLVGDLPVRLGALDYCLRANADGRRVAYDPDTVLRQKEPSDSSEEAQGWQRWRLDERWPSLAAGDPYWPPAEAVDPR
jgi:glycosyltransferase involved in cell wall biosynthesis